MNKYSPQIPDLVMKVPEQERDTARHIEVLIHELSFYVGNFHAALALLHAAREQRQKQPQATDMMIAWIGIAMRDSTVTVFNFSETLEAISTAARGHPTIKSLVNWPAFKAARKKLITKFPDRTGLRHNVTHAGELGGTQKSAKENSTSQDFDIAGIKVTGGSDVRITGLVSNETFFGTHQGNLRHADLSEASLLAIIDICDTLIGAFENRPSDGDQIESSVD